MATNFGGEPVDLSRDLVAIALRGMASAILLGTAVAGIVLWAVQKLVAAGSLSTAPVARGPAPLLLLGGTMVALVISAGTAWRRLAPLDSYYRRGALALVCAFATFVLAVLAAPLHHFLGGSSLLGLAAAAGAGALLLGRGRSGRERVS